jgi:tetratricopeptide (TPR) repeat protein
LLATLAFSFDVSADTLKLKSGKVVHGKIVERNSRTIQLDVGLDFPITYYIDEVVDVSQEEEIPLPPVAAKDIPVANPNETKADSVEQEGLSLIDQGQVDQGVDLLREAVRLDPRGNRQLNLGSILIGNGISLQKDGRSAEAAKIFQEAESELQQAIKLFDPDEETMFLSEAYNLLGDIYANALDDKSKARQYYQKSLTFYENPAAKRGLAVLP